MNIASQIKMKSWNWFLALATDVIALVADILYIVMDGADKTFSLAAFVVILIAALCTVAEIFLSFRCIALGRACLYSVGFAFVIYAGVPTLTDLFNNVVVIGGNTWAVLCFGGVFLFCTLLAVINCFFPWQREKIVLMSEVSAE